MAEREGVVRYECVHRDEALPAALAPLAAALAAWRRVLAALGLVGRDPSRYGGLGFGNLSARVAPGERPFLVTGTQTGHLPHLPLAGFARVDRWDTAANRLESAGLTRPSSESLTHAALYDLSPEIAAVFHVHSPELWRRTELPRTAPDVGYGTPEMAAEVGRLWREQGRPPTGLLAMAGHEDGLVAWGRGLDEAGRRAVTLDRKLPIERGELIRPGEPES